MSDRSTATLPRRALLRGRRVTRFLLGYLVHFLRSNYVVTKEILTPGSQLSPAVVIVPVRSRTQAEVATYMSLINLSPGTITLALSQDRSRLTVHGMHASDPAAFREELQALESQLLLAWRPVDATPPDQEPDRPSDRPPRR